MPDWLIFTLVTVVCVGGVFVLIGGLDALMTLIGAPPDDTQQDRRSIKTREGDYIDWH